MFLQTFMDMLRAGCFDLLPKNTELHPCQRVQFTQYHVLGDWVSNWEERDIYKNPKHVTLTNKRQLTGTRRPHCMSSLESHSVHNPLVPPL